MDHSIARALVLILATLLGLSFVVHGQATLLTDCPNGWSKDRNSCYYTGERFNDQTWYSASSFCQSMGSNLVEINDNAELNFVKALIRKTSWSDGPWVGLLRPFGDTRWIFPSTRAGSSGDGALDKLLGALTVESSHDCGGFNRNGEGFGFWRCRNGGSPICEMNLKTA